MPNMDTLRLSDDDDNDDCDDQDDGTMAVSNLETATNTADHRPSTKSFLSRAFEPVTNLFKSKSHQRSPTPVDTEATSYCVDDLHSASSSSNAESLSPDKTTRRASESTDATDATTNDVSVKMGGHRLRHIDSGETASWWDNNDDVNEDDDDDITTADDNDDTTAEDITLNSSIEPAPPPPPPVQRQGTSAVAPLYRITRIESGEKAWWLDDSPSKEESPKPKVTPPSGPFRIRPVESGERAWWMADNNDSDSQPSETAAVATATAVPIATTTDSVDATATFTLRRTTTQSPSAGSDAWWMRSDNDDSGRATSEMSTATTQPLPPLPSTRSSPPAVVRSENNVSPRRIFLPLRLQHADSGELPWWMQSNDDESTSEPATATATSAPTSVTADNLLPEATIEYVAPIIAAMPRSRPTSSAFFDIEQLQELGDRASPEGVEDPALQQSLTRRPRTLFISRHTNIDDLLGGGCHQLSPVMDDRRFEAATAASTMRSPTPTTDFDLW